MKNITSLFEAEEGVCDECNRFALVHMLPVGALCTRCCTSATIDEEDDAQLALAELEEEAA